MDRKSLRQSDAAYGKIDRALLSFKNASVKKKREREREGGEGEGERGERGCEQ